MPDATNEALAGLPGLSQAIIGAKEKRRKQAEERSEAIRKANEAQQLEDDKSAFLGQLGDIQQTRSDSQLSPTKAASIAQRMVTPEFNRLGVRAGGTSQIMALLKTLSGDAREEMEDLIEEGAMQRTLNEGSPVPGENPALSPLIDEAINGLGPDKIDVEDITSMADLERISTIQPERLPGNFADIAATLDETPAPVFDDFNSIEKIEGALLQDPPLLTEEQAEPFRQALRNAAAFKESLKPETEGGKKDKGGDFNKAITQVEQRLGSEIKSLEAQTFDTFTKKDVEGMSPEEKEDLIKYDKAPWTHIRINRQAQDSAQVLQNILNDPTALAATARRVTAIDELIAAGVPQEEVQELAAQDDFLDLFKIWKQGQQ